MSASVALCRPRLNIIRGDRRSAELPLRANSAVWDRELALWTSM